LLAVGPASVLGPVAREAALPRGADYQFSDRTGPSGQAEVQAVAGAEAEAERAPRALGRPVGALVVQALLLALVLALGAAVGARRLPWPRWAWGLMPALRRARSWSIPARPGGSAVR
jgi:hypothetical protein